MIYGQLFKWNKETKETEKNMIPFSMHGSVSIIIKPAGEMKRERKP